MALQDIDHIVVLMQENRSFDHMLGYLNLPGPGRIPVDGIGDAAWKHAHANVHAGQAYEPYRLDPSVQKMVDPRHGFRSIGDQIDTPAQGAPSMGGFVTSYATQDHAPPAAEIKRVMGYYDAAAVPTFDFLARNFAVCDRWFSSLPAGTQPNRMMAMSGGASSVQNEVPLPKRRLVYDWLADIGEHQWCAYQWGAYMPFMALMLKWLPKILLSLSLSEYGANDQRFRRYTRFGRDWRSTRAMPPVIFIEPEYSDGPRDDPTDDHPPTGVAKGQAMVADIYNTLISNPDRWARTVFLITYDEHGGFFDHVPPPQAPTVVDGQQVATLGVRVPALIVSPQVAPGSVFSETLDHTSILRLIAEKLNGGVYSPEVDARQAYLGKISNALGPPSARRPQMQPPTVLALSALQAHAPLPEGQPDPHPASDAAMVEAFQLALREAAVEYPDVIGTHAFRALEARAKSLLG